MIDNRTISSRSKGSTLIELLISLSVVTMVSASVFAGLSQLMLFNSQDEVMQGVRDDVYLAMNYIRRDIRLASNVVSNAGSHVTNGTTLVLRQPKMDLNLEIIPDEFQYVTYTILPGGPYEGGGLLRELWDTRDAVDPLERELLNVNLVTLGFLYGGKSISQITNLSSIRDIEMILISARETKLRKETSEGDVGDYIDLQDLQYMAESGTDFSYLRAYIDYMNSVKVDIAVASSMGSATVRNKNALGLKTVETPGTIAGS